MPQRLRRGAGVASLLAAALALAGCTDGRDTAPPTPVSSAVRSAPAPTPTPAPLAHVLIIVLENKPSWRILGSAHAPYLNALARRSALARNYRAIRHPSLPNYLALASGTTAGVSKDCAPDECGVSVRTIASAVTASGRSWGMYAESMPAPCTMHNVGRYAVRHNPFLYDRAITSDKALCAKHDVPADRLAADLADDRLPDYAWLIPNLCHDMHSCDTATGDRWLAQAVPQVLASKPFRTSRSLLVLTFDEGSATDNHIVTVLAGSAAKSGAVSRRPYTHYSLLRTIEDAWGLQPLTSHDAAATAMTDLLR